MPEISDAELARLTKRDRVAKARAKAIKAERAKVAGLAAVEAERDQLRQDLADAKAADPASADARVAELTGKLRQLTHRAAFDKLAKGKLDDGMLDAAWQLAGITPEADDVDEAALSTALDGLLAKYPKFAATPAGDGAPPAERPLAPPPGGGKGSDAGGTAETQLDRQYAATGRSIPGRI